MTDFERQDYNQRQLLIAHRNGEIPYERAKEYWSEKERKELKNRYENGGEVSQMAIQFQRSETAIIQQLTLMALTTPVDKQRTRGPRISKCKCPRCQEFACPYYSGEDGACHA